MINDGLVMLKANVRSCSHTIKVRTQLYIDLVFVMNDVFWSRTLKYQLSFRCVAHLYYIRKLCKPKNSCL